MTDLRTRLQMLRELMDERAGNNGSDKESDKKEQERVVSSLQVMEDWDQIGEFSFLKTECIPLEGLSVVQRDLEVMAQYFEGSLDHARWYDTETTGLSGGAGTMVFLYGSVRLQGTILMLRQLFLSDYPGEEEFLLKLMELEEFSQDLLFFSYNGSAYDAPLLKSRFILQRLSPPFLQQADLLYLVRRLWRRMLPDCSLSTVERSILNRYRTGDIPGRMIPQVYFDFLRTGDREGIDRVLLHNREDLLSLVQLTAFLGTLLRDPSLGNGLDRTALGLMATKIDPDRGWFFLEKLARNGDPSALSWVARRYKKLGKEEEARTLREPFVTDLYSAAVAQMKYLEHRRRDYGSALHLAEWWLNKNLPQEERKALEHRFVRLHRKYALQSGRLNAE